MPVNVLKTTKNKTIYTAGRPPWYDSHGSLKEAFVIGRLILIDLYHGVAILILLNSNSL